MATPEVTQLPREWSGGKKTALDCLTPVGYDELPWLAAIYLHREQSNHTLQATDYVSCAAGWRSPNMGNTLRVAGDPKAALALFALAVRLREAKVWNDLGDMKRAARRLPAERNPAAAGTREEVAGQFSEAVSQYENALGLSAVLDKEETARIRVRPADARVKKP